MPRAKFIRTILAAGIILPLLAAAPPNFSRNYSIVSADPASLGFGISKISNRVLTPNGDKVNDTVVFEFYNDADLEFSGKIFDLNWALVAHMFPGPAEKGDSLQWDGKRQGSVVPSGVYIYMIRAEDKIFTGTLIVLR